MNLKNDNVFIDIKSYEDKFFNTIFCDPPYNLSSVWYIDTDGKYKIKKKSDFMNKWDGLDENDLDLFFGESFRTLKYGGYLLMFGMDRQLAPFTYYAVKNGFEVQQSLYWYYISNFPKATDVSKGIDKRFGAERKVNGISSSPNGKMYDGKRYKEKRETKFGTVQDQPDKTEPSTDLAKKYDGYKYSISPLKQVLETVLVFRKPIKNNSILDDVIESETDNEISPSILDINGNRVSYKSENDIIPQIRQNKRDINSDRVMYGGNSFEQSRTKAVIGGSRDGRYPSQMFIECTCDKVIEEGVDKKPFEYKNNEYIAEGFINNIKPNSPSNYNDAHKKIIHTNPECPCAILDKQHGNVKGGSVNAGVEQGFGGSNNTYGDGVHTNEFSAYGDVGGASKVLQQIKYEEDELDLLFYNSKVSSKERNEGLEDLEKKERLFNGKSDKSSKEMKDVEERFTTSPSPNNHPTLKPIELINRISSLFKLPEECDQKVYVPFCGVFSEIIGFVKAGYKIDNIYGCELSEDYYNIGLKRLEHYTKKFNKPKSSLEKFL